MTGSPRIFSGEGNSPPPRFADRGAAVLPRAFSLGFVAGLAAAAPGASLPRIAKGRGRKLPAQGQPPGLFFAYRRLFYVTNRAPARA